MITNGLAGRTLPSIASRWRTESPFVEAISKIAAMASGVLVRSGEKVFLQISKFLFLTFILSAASAVSAVPTATNGNAISKAGLSGDDSRAVSVHHFGQLAESSDSSFAAAAAEFLEAPEVSTDRSESASVRVRTLPAIPGAVLMVLTGFVCVSLVRDRRVWLAALAGLIWAGQAGIQTIDRFAYRATHKSHHWRWFDARLAYTDEFGHPCRLRSDIEGTQYIGLLHHLAGIPDSTFLLPASVPSSRMALASLPARRSSFSLPANRLTSIQTATAFTASPPAIIYLSSYPVLLLKCLAAEARQFICFSPAFIFENLPRGPPLPG